MAVPVELSDQDQLVKIASTSLNSKVMSLELIFLSLGVL